MRFLSTRRLPLTARLTLATTALVALVVASVTALAVEREHQTYRDQLEHQAEMLLDTLSVASGNALYLLDADFLEDLIEELTTDRIESLVSTRIYDRDGRVIADSETSDPLAFRLESDPFGETLLASDASVLIWRDETLLAGRAIIYGRQRFGAVSIELATHALYASIATARIQGLTVALAAIAIGIVASLLISRTVTRPLRELTEATERIVKGDLAHRLAVRGGDETAALGNAFNAMTAQLQSTVNHLQERADELTRTNANLMREVAERKRMQEQLDQHASELEQHVAERAAELIRAKEQVEVILNSSSDAIIRIYANGDIRQANPAFTALFGDESGEALGHSLESLFTADSRPSLRDALSEVVSSKRPSRVELVALRHDGTAFDADVALAPIAEREGENAVNVLCSVRDITERKRMELALAEERNLLRTLMDTVPDLLFVKDVHSRFVISNTAHLRHMSAETMEEVAGKTDFDRFPEDLAAQYYADEQEVLRTGNALINREEMSIDRAGNVLWLLTTKVPWYDQLGQLMGIVGIGRNITGRRHMEEELRQALAREKELGELKSRFLAMVSHEFRTPLASIQSSSELLKNYHDRVSEERRRDHLEKIRAQIKRLTSLLDDILLIGRADLMGVELSPTALDLDEFCRTLAGEMQQLAPAHQIVFTQCGDCLSANADEKLLRQAVMNLLTNASKYSPEGSTIQFDLSCENNHAVIRVSDQGIGIPADDLPHLFENFHRGKNVGRIPGTGLGLVIVKQAVEAHGGNIAVQTQAGAGTTFTVTLPLSVQNGRMA